MSKIIIFAIKSVRTKHCSALVVRREIVGLSGGPQKTGNRLAVVCKAVPLCPGREHFYMLIINALQKIQAKTQAVLECHNIRMIAPNKGSKINGKIGDEPIFFYDPFIGQHVSVVNVVVRIRQESIERPMDRIVFP